MGKKAGGLHIHSKHDSPFHEVAMAEEEYLPSERYKGIMCRGAEKLGLAEPYLTMLDSLPTYSSATRPEVLRARAEREKARESLRLISREELAGHKTDSPWISCLSICGQQVQLVPRKPQGPGHHQ